MTVKDKPMTKLQRQQQIARERKLQIVKVYFTPKGSHNECNKCQILLRGQDSAVKHYERHLEEASGYQYRCHRCFRIYSYSDSLRSHLRVDHGLDIKKEEVKKKFKVRKPKPKANPSSKQKPQEAQKSEAGVQKTQIVGTSLAS